MKYLIVQAFWYYDNVTGEFQYRIQGPGDALDRQPQFQVVNIHVFHPLFPQLVLSADLLILHLMPDAEMSRIIRLRKKAGRATVFEIADNFLSVGPWVGPDDAYRNPVVRQHFLYHASLCDGCQFSTEEVAKVFAFLNPNYRVFENQVTHSEKKSPSSRPLVLGWGGSIGHREDLAVIAATIIDFCQSHDDVRFVYMGHPPMYHELFSALGEKGRCIPSGPVEAYYQFLTSIHLGLAPLSDTDFNRCRSDVKFIEYAAHHVVPLLSDATAYQGHARHEENACIFHNPSELASLLEGFYAQPERVNALANAAYDYATGSRVHAKHVNDRTDFYLSLLGHAPLNAQIPPLPECAGLIAYMRQATHQFDSGQFQQALDTLNRVLSMHANYQLAHVYKIKTLLALRRFEEVLNYAACEIHPIYHDLFYECFTNAALELNNASWRDVLAMLEDPVLKILLDPEHNKNRELRARKILKHNPFVYEALRDLLASLKHRETEQDLYSAVLKRALFMAPEDETLVTSSLDFQDGETTNPLRLEFLLQ